jgi:hypothetical protein
MSEKFVSKGVDENGDGLDICRNILIPMVSGNFFLFLSAVAKLWKAAVFSLVISVCLSAWNKTAFSGQILMIFI